MPNPGDLYYGGAGFAQDFKEAARWIQKAAEQGREMAHFDLGAMYRNGRESPKTSKKQRAGFE
jgi:TPR repeat protein